MKHEYMTPEIQEIEVFAEGLLAASTFVLEDYQSNGNALELEF